MKEPLIELRGVSKRFGDNVILDGLDLTIYRGEALVIIGPSGTGKSTVLRLIAGLTGINAGEIRIKGQLRQGLLEDGREAMRTSLVFQQTALFDSLTVGENVGFYLYEQTNLKKAIIRELVEKSLEMVGLQGISDLYPSELSGEMRKRVAFARAIITNPDNPADNPELLLYDEPTAGLDPIASTIIEDLVRTLHEKSGSANTYVMVSHQQSTIRRTADRVVFLYQGKVQWQGVVADIDRTDHPMIRQFFSASIEGPIRTIV
ncbi:ABC transporter ATP-binding protein [Microcystis aeruginosa]|uniref:L-cystine import ATP-binding protein TcyN n=1 Tax=Microcystis aeruginosa SPC777 TaxID=482300 RepID=S3KJZ3_MICAE|nr:ATP-binding cassette domain-containing protein [Microcystis aeruginosa]EPF23622.1 L-cystine import ATP-binding protein TcyN [Microcystis aeruginosa SPC777]EPF24859.1 L-cystine import ATP-binding protein TcyN [Microcystis aeruginosa SPC777]OCY13686.1 MAG: ABC transporter ATP-binding protein [Microcystis aeruginosa CACIAM 03]